jgi:hypothetical protein
MNRKQRRAQAKIAPQANLQAARSQVKTALEALQRIKGLEGTAHMLDGLGGQITEVGRTLDSLARRIDSLESELQVQRTVNLKLLAHLVADRGSVRAPKEQVIDLLVELEKQIRDGMVE